MAQNVSYPCAITCEGNAKRPGISMSPRGLHDFSYEFSAKSEWSEHQRIKQQLINGECTQSKRAVQAKTDPL